MIEAYSEPGQTFKTEVLGEILNVWRLLVIFAKSSILDLSHGCGYTHAWYEVEGYIGLTLVTQLFLNYP